LAQAPRDERASAPVFHHPDVRAACDPAAWSAFCKVQSKKAPTDANWSKKHDPVSHIVHAP
jgi:hypothetical protein